MNDICKSLFTAVQSLAPKTEYEEFYKEEIYLSDPKSGVIEEATPETYVEDTYLTKK